MSHVPITCFALVIRVNDSLQESILILTVGRTYQCDFTSILFLCYLLELSDVIFFIKCIRFPDVMQFPCVRSHPRFYSVISYSLKHTIHFDSISRLCALDYFQLQKYLTRFPQFFGYSHPQPSPSRKRNHVLLQVCFSW